ncbi:hypothetical protein C8J55DRAFT_19978 [Lentinula edodes]|uniref:Uncharacterized protein n=1 Tax=Lentinula lateritia TaxID=40482 RepID=A0A9W9ANX1_9AGAR|nr:hypothetical protein C8J55DRAFT_19978 [Lentinula edodes]
MKAGGGAMNFFPPIVFTLIGVTQSRTAGGPGDLLVFPSWERKPASDAPVFFFSFHFSGVHPALNTFEQILHISCMC